MYDGSGTLINGVQRVYEVSFNYLEVPINILYHIPVGIGKIFIGGGPYIALGLSGKNKFYDKSSAGGGSTSNAGEGDVTFGSNNGDIKNPDYGINVLGGISLKKGVRFSIGYGVGLNNLSNAPGYTIKNNNLSLSIGYTF